MHDFTTLRMADLTPSQAYEVLIATVIPRPIAFVSTESGEGHRNLAPFSFFMVGGSNPPSLMFSPTTTQRGQEKDTLANVQETGEFVVNLVDRSMADGMNATSRGIPAEESEWDLTPFTAVPSDAVRPPRVQESLASFECRVFEIVRHGIGPMSANYVIGEVLVAHLSRIAWESGPILNNIRPIARAGGREYLDLSGPEFFELSRPNS
jgi:flavin reductase (DIM6/NTAB) family NADH-FMN oxidoreductase RutF